MPPLGPLLKKTPPIDVCVCVCVCVCVEIHDSRAVTFHFKDRTRKYSLHSKSEVKGQIRLTEP